MDRVAVVLLAVTAVVAGTAGLASAHVNDVRADPQVSTDGTVRVESVFIGAEGWLVLHRDDGGEIGAPIGHRFLPAVAGFRTDVPVRMDQSVWRSHSGNASYWVALHTDDGDRTFDPDEDRLVESFGSPAADRFVLGTGPAPAYVSARHLSLPESRGNVTIRRVYLPADGHVVVTTGGNATGEVAGSRALPAGRHRNVTVALDRSGAVPQRGAVTLSAVLHRDDGDGVLDEDDPRLRVGDAPVATRFRVVVTVADGPTDDGSGAAPSNATSTAPLVNTPTGPATTSPATSPAHATGSSGDGGPPAPGGAGFGLLVALAALPLAGWLAGWRAG